MKDLPLWWWAPVVVSGLWLGLALATCAVSTFSPCVPSGDTCLGWTVTCAQHKALAECRADARLLGCPEGWIP